MPEVSGAMRGGQLVCLNRNALFLLEGQRRLYSPTPTEFIEMVPEPIVAHTRYTAALVARTIEYDVHARQRGYWDAMKKEWMRAIQLQASWTFDSITTCQERVDMGNMGEPVIGGPSASRYAARFPQSGGGRPPSGYGKAWAT